MAGCCHCGEPLIVEVGLWLREVVVGRGCWCTAEELGDCVGMLYRKSMYSKKAISPELVSVRFFGRW